MAGLATGILKNTTGTGVPSIAVAADFPTLNQNTLGNASTATLATTATNIAGGSVGSIPYQTGSGATSLLNAGTAGYVLTANGSSAPSWAPVSLSSGTSGTLPVASGGTGVTTLSAGIVKSNGTSAFTRVDAPAGAIVGTSDTQELTNKTLGAGTALGTPSSGTLSSCTGLSLTTGVTGILPVANGGTGTSSGVPLATGVTGILPVANGGTGSDSGVLLETGVDGILPVANGGTGFSSYAIGDLIYADTTASVAKLADVATGNVLLSGGINTAPSYGKVGLTTHVTGTLLATNGGTGFSSYAIGDLIYANTTASVAKLADVATGNVLLSGGIDTAPSYGKVDLDTHTTGIVPISKGGIGTDFEGYSGFLYNNATDYNLTLISLLTHVEDILPVANGGTGVGTLTGYVKGNGTGVMTAAATVPVEDISGTLSIGKGGTSYTKAPRAVLSRSGGFATQAIGTSGTFVVAAQGGIIAEAQDMTVGAANTFSLKNTSGVTRHFFVTARARIGMAANPANEQTIAIRLFKGVAGGLTSVDNSDNRDLTPARWVAGTTNANTFNPVSLYTQWVISLNNNEEVAVYYTNVTSTASLAMEQVYMTAQAIL
jgi:hypothetical protein